MEHDEPLPYVNATMLMPCIGTRKEKVNEQRGSGLYTIGYEGRTIEEFISHLHSNAVEVLVDVRELPVSRKPGFSKTKLSHRLGRVDIEYLHLRSLGSPRESRKRLRQYGDFQQFSEEYEEHLDGRVEDIAALWSLVESGRRAALMCFERDHAQCHRTLLVHRLLNGVDNPPEVIHL